MKRSILTGLVLAVSMVAACTPVPSGQKNGTLTHFQKEGLVFKTMEAEIIRGGSYGGNTGVQGAAFDFTVRDPALIEKVQTAFDNQQEVRITYHRSWPTFFSSSSNGNFLDSIEVISAEQGGTDRGGAPNTTAGDTKTIERMLEQNNRLLEQNARTLAVVEKVVNTK